MKGISLQELGRLHVIGEEVGRRSCGDTAVIMAVYGDVTIFYEMVLRNWLLGM